MKGVATVCLGIIEWMGVVNLRLIFDNWLQLKARFFLESELRYRTMQTSFKVELKKYLLILLSCFRV